VHKFAFSLITTVLFMFSFVFSVSAHATQSLTVVHHSRQPVVAGPVRPQATGGGCSSVSANGTGDIAAKSCISYAYSYLQPDGYAWFYPLSGSNQHGGPSSCRFRLQVYEGTSFLEQIDYNCAVDAASYNQYVHYGPLSIFATAPGVSYYSIVQVRIQYADGYTTYCYPNASPAVTL
jgi:hypothetical protein